MSIILNAKSWHHRLATVYSNHNPHRLQDNNICSYSKCVIAGFFNALLVVFISSIVLYMQLAIAMYVTASLATGHWVDLFADNAEATVAQFGIIMDVFLLAVVTILLAGAAYGQYDIKRRHNKIHKQPKQPGFIKVWYSSVKEKTCIPISFK